MDRDMRALKILVVALGALLVVGTVALVAGIVGRIENRSPASGLETANVRRITAALPLGSRIVSTELSGDRVLVRVARGDGAEMLLLFDARNGTELAVIDLASTGSRAP